MNEQSFIILPQSRRLSRRQCKRGSEFNGQAWRRSWRLLGQIGYRRTSGILRDERSEVAKARRIDLLGRVERSANPSKDRCPARRMGAAAVRAASVAVTVSASFIERLAKVPKQQPVASESRSGRKYSSASRGVGRRSASAPKDETLYTFFTGFVEDRTESHGV